MKIINKIRYGIEGFFFRHSVNSQTLRKLKDSWKEKPAIIVGNGPSLQKTPLEKFSNFNSIGMNKINLLFDQTKWRPSLITCVNRHVISQNSSFFSRTSIPLLLAWQSRYFLKGRLGNEGAFFLNSNKVYFSRSFDQEVGAGATVTFTALQLAYYLGADPIIILGVDHSFQVKGIPHETQIRKGNDPNHFHPDYFAHGAKWNLPDLETSERAYELARKEFNRKGKTILDATINGKLTVFPKVSIKKALSILNKAQ